MSQTGSGRGCICIIPRYVKQLLMGETVHDDYRYTAWVANDGGATEELYDHKIDP